ncbi:hypothetical protein G7046_g9459 [Stylonectria norvegica]|nr:hypothetical protein G7046_g9459 [Stylonectria norvegica]
MISAGESSPETLVGSGSSAIISAQSSSDYDRSVGGDEWKRRSISEPRKDRGRGGKPRWLSQVKDWLSVSEPSAQAMKQQKRNTFQHHGIKLNDPQAAAKLHFPMGKVPEGAITSTSGPSPEKALKRAKERQMRQSYSGFSQNSESVSSSIFSSTKEPNPVTPWETFTMPLFGNGKGDQNGNDAPNGNGQDHDEPERAPADEHTRLLPNRVDSPSRPGPRLNPDDPAVSPYNLASVRILRHVTVFFTVLTFVWWILLLVSEFATPPGFQAKGSGFLAFSYASLTLANLLFTLVFFGVPSKAVRILAVFMAAIFLIDMIVILSVNKTRYEEGWDGVASVIWALLMSLWTLLADRTVKWGKEEEEERLTGRAETRRTLFEWTEVMLSTIAYAVMSVAIVLITLNIIIRALDSRLAPPGKLYDVDGGKFRVHLYCNGNKTDSRGTKLPTVFFEGGERPVEQLWEFAENGLSNGSFSRYCFADRPGFAWSDTSPSPLSAGFAVDALSQALAKADETGPWVIASAGIGTLYSRIFSARHGDDIKGLVLIDPLHEDYLGEIASSSRGLLLWLRGVLSPLGLDRLPGAIFRGRTSADRIYGRSAQQSGKLIFAKLQESLLANSFTRRDVEGSREIQHKDTPLVVISSGKHIKASGKWERKQRDLTKLTDNLKAWDIVDKAPHEVWTTLEGREKIEKRLRQLVHACPVSSLQVQSTKVKYSAPYPLHSLTALVVTVTGVVTEVLPSTTTTIIIPNQYRTCNHHTSTSTTTTTGIISHPRSLSRAAHRPIAVRLASGFCLAVYEYTLQPRMLPVSSSLPSSLPLQHPHRFQFSAPSHLHLHLPQSSPQVPGVRSSLVGPSSSRERPHILAPASAAPDAPCFASSRPSTLNWYRYGILHRRS